MAHIKTSSEFNKLLALDLPCENFGSDLMIPW